MKRATLLICGALIAGACGGGSDAAADSAAAATTTDSAAVGAPSTLPAPAPTDTLAPDTSRMTTDTTADTSRTGRPTP